MSLVLAKLLEELAAGRLRVVDLTQPLSPQTPLLPLPPQFNKHACIQDLGALALR